MNSCLNELIDKLELVELPGYFLTKRILPALLYPGRQPAKAGRTGDIINEEHGVDVTVVVLHHRLPEALLSRRVPQLELMVRRGKKGKKSKNLRSWLLSTVDARDLNIKRGNENKGSTKRQKNIFHVLKHSNIESSPTWNRKKKK